VGGKQWVLPGKYIKKGGIRRVKPEGRGTNKDHGLKKRLEKERWVV